MSSLPNHAIFLINCPDRKGIVASVSAFFFERGFNIVHCQQYTDPEEGRFFMRILIDLDSAPSSRSRLEEGFGALAQQFQMRWSLRYSRDRVRVGVLVTKEPHCLFDLLSRCQTGDIPNVDVCVALSNHGHLEAIASQFHVPFFLCPVEREARRTQEREITRILRQHHVELAVLARYMQVLSSEMLAEVEIPIINIHHAFLPAFQGASPYRRAWERGVKMIGATAHYVTAALDEGPIIEQDVERVNHEESQEALRTTGADIEKIVLARAVKAHVEHRVIIHANRTIVFSRGC